MASPLSSFVDNLSDARVYSDCPHCKSPLDYMIIKDGKVVFRCFECKKNYKNNFYKELIKRFANIYEFCNDDINKFMLLLREGIYPYEYMDSWGRFDKRHFYSQLTIENITDVDHRHAKECLKALIIKI